MWSFPQLWESCPLDSGRGWTCKIFVESWWHCTWCQFDPPHKYCAEGKCPNLLRSKALRRQNQWKKALRQTRCFEKYIHVKMLLTSDWNFEGVALLWFEDEGDYEDSIFTVYYVATNAVNGKPGLCLVGAGLHIMDLFGVLVEVEVKGASFAGSHTCGDDLLPFTNHTVVNMENWFWQSWKPKNVRNVLRFNRALKNKVNCCCCI